MGRGSKPSAARRPEWMRAVTIRVAILTSLALGTSGCHVVLSESLERIGAPPASDGGRIDGGRIDGGRIDGGRTEADAALTSDAASDASGSCAEILAARPESPSGVYTIAPRGVPFDAYCDMESDEGGWTLAAKIVYGSSSSWLYDSSWWTDPDAPIHSSPDLSIAEARYEPFVVLPFTTIRLVDPEAEREVHLADAHDSLVDLFATTSPPGIDPDPSTGGTVPESPAERSATVARYDMGAFARESSYDYNNICRNAEALGPWADTVGVGYNAAGAYRSDGVDGDYNLASGRARIGTWLGGSNSWIWRQTADCVYGLGVETHGYGGTTISGTTMGLFTTVWLR
jgi:hypothetical protein